MMNNDKHYIKEIKRIIDLDVIEIILERTSYIDDDYGGKIKEISKVNVNGRLYNKKSIRELTGVKGEYLGITSTAAEKLLTLIDADVIEGDVFTVENRTYRVSFVNKYLNLCKQIELEVLENGIDY